MSQWVLDASVTVAWCFEDERTPHVEALLKRLFVSPAIVPQLWPFEVANVLAMATRKGRVTQAERSRFLGMLITSPVTIDHSKSPLAFRDVLPLAETHRLTVYDAAYLELALRRGLPLATLDKALAAAAASAAGVPLL